MNSTHGKHRHKQLSVITKWSSLPLDINYLLFLRAQQWPQESRQSHRHRVSEPGARRDH